MLTSSSALPRWLSARAARLSAAVLEAIIDVHGHARLLERLADVQFGRALAAGLGLPDENDLGAVARVVQLGLKRDEARLGVAVDPAAAVITLADGRVTPLFSVDGERVVRLGRARPAVDVERRLGAALLLAHTSRPLSSAPFSWEPFHRPRPGTGPRSLLALSLLSCLVVEESVPPELTRLSLGSAAGRPFGVPLVIYDNVLRALEGVLHGASASRRGGRQRLAPVLALHEELLRTVPRASRHDVTRFSRREQRFARDLASRTMGDGALLPVPLPRRPARTVTRPLHWRPELPSSTRTAGQRELFAP